MPGFTLGNPAEATEGGAEKPPDLCKKRHTRKSNVTRGGYFYEQNNVKASRFYQPYLELAAHVLAGSSLEGVFKSTNGGLSWVRTGPGPTFVRPLVMDPSAPNTIYAGTQDAGVWKSTDGGETWQNIGLVGRDYVWALAIDPDTPSTIYAGTDPIFVGRDLGGVWKSTDGGASWSTTGLTNRAVISLAIDPLNSSTIYAGTWGGSIFVSYDAGLTW